MLPQRFLDKVEQVPFSECWYWTGARNDRGYAVMNSDVWYAHRIAYIETYGPIPRGLEIDHKCGVRSCVNPAHLEAVTHRENVRRGSGWPGINSRKTHCPFGHEYTPANTLMYGNPPTRSCRACHDRRNAERVR